jgi:DNA repair exonuclease SbcCD nuclease subunit
MKIAITADVHIDKNKNLPFIVETCKWINQTCVEKGIEHLIIAGDFSNNRNKLDVYAINAMLDVVNTWGSSGITCYFLMGNHELYHRQNLVETGEITAINIFQKHCHVFNRYTRVSLGDCNLYFLPWIDNKELYIQSVGLIADTASKSQTNVLISHQEIFGAVMNDLSRTKDTTGIQSTTFNKFTACFFGHYHERQVIDDFIYYVGSPITLNHGEGANPKGLTVFDTDTKEVTFIENPHNPLYITIYEEAQIKPLIENEQFTISKFVRVRGNYSKEDKASIEAQLLQAGALEVLFQPIKTDTESVVIETHNKSIDEIIVDYVDKVASPTMDKDYTVMLGKQLMMVD